MEIILINTPRNVRAIRGLTASLPSQNSLPIRKTQQRQQSHGVTPGCCCDQYIRFFLWFCFFVTFFDFYISIFYYLNIQEWVLPFLSMK